MKDMKLAISVFEDQVSPRFDCAQSILFVDLTGGKYVSRRLVPISGMNGIKQMKSISVEGVSVIICGGMPGFYHRMAESIGVEVIQTSGSVEEILDCIKNGAQPPNKPSCYSGRGSGFSCGNEILREKEVENMPDKDGTGPAGKGSGAGRRQGKCGLKKSGGPVDVKVDVSGSEETDTRKDERGRIRGKGNSSGNNKGRQKQ